MRGALARATGSCGLQMRVIASASRRRIAGATNSLDAYSFGLHFSCLSSLFTLTVTGTMPCLSDCSRFPAEFCIVAIDKELGRKVTLSATAADKTRDAAEVSPERSAVAAKHITNSVLSPSIDDRPARLRRRRP